MGSPKIVVQILSIFIFFLFLTTTTQSCSMSFCRPNEAMIRFPFRIIDQQSDDCGYPGFELSCDTDNLTVLKLPNSEKFSIQAIDYGTQEIWINDPNNCLPKKLLSFNLSGSPFSGVYYNHFSFFNCSSFDYLKYKLNPISCLSGLNYTVFATTSMDVIHFLSSRCNLVTTVEIPSQFPYYEEIWSSDLNDDLWLTWREPSCGTCELRGGRCGFKSNSSHEIGCFNSSPRGIPKAARYAIVIGVGIPVFLCVIGIGCCICGRISTIFIRRERISEFTVVTVNTWQSTAINTGLDGPTLESYPKIVLGESRRLPKPDDDTCSICMCEYKPKETLKSIPECHHCFHADCIDEWLTLNATCPICRTSPEPKVFNS